MTQSDADERPAAQSEVIVLPPRPFEPEPEPESGVIFGDHVVLPWGFDEFTCPSCERTIPTRKQIRMAVPAKWEHLLNQCFKCPYCNFIWSPRRIEAQVFRK